MWIKVELWVTFIWYNNLHSGNFFDKKWLVYTSILSSLVYADIHFHSLLFLYINQEFDIMYGVSLKFIREKNFLVYKPVASKNMELMEFCCSA